MKVSELFTMENGIYRTIFEVNYPIEYVYLFGEVDARLLDSLTLLHYGDRNLISKIDETNYEDIIKATISVNIDNWSRMAGVMRAEYDILMPFMTDYDLTETTTVEEANIDESVTAGKFFNDPNFIENGTETKDRSREKLETKNTTYSRKGGISSNSISTNIEKEIKLREASFIKNILYLMIKEVSLSVY